MSWLDTGIKWVMVVAGLLTCTMFYAAVAPQAALQSTFGQTLDGPVAEIVVRNWGALIGLVGLGLLYGAFRPGARRLALALAAASKIVFIVLILTQGRQFLGHQAGVAVVVDSVMVLIFAAYLFRTTRTVFSTMTLEKNERYVFHLSIAVSELVLAKRFYVETLGARVGRENDGWLDVLLWGHQITLQRAPDETLPAGRRGKRHFGVVLPWAEWEREAKRLEEAGVSFLERPAVLKEGTEDEQAKLYLQDPSGNVIEIKAYRNVRRTLGLEELSGQRMGAPASPARDTSTERNRMSLLLLIVAIVAVGNLALSLWSAMRAPQVQSTVSMAESAPKKMLPEAVTSAERDRIFDSLKEHFNAHDTDALYAMLDPVARVQISKEQFSMELEKLTLFGTILEGVYSHYEFGGTSDGVDWFQLVYKARLLSPQFKVATVVVSLSSTPTGPGYRIMGFRINSSS